MRRVLILLAAVGVALAVVVLFLISSPDAQDMFKSRQVVKDQKLMNKMVFGYVGNPYTDDYKNSRIPGYMQNNGRDKIAAVDLEIALYNGDGDRKELVKYTVRDIAPGKRKSFDANAGTLDGPRTAKVKLVRVEVVK